MKSIEIEWGIFSLVEFIVSERKNFGSMYKNAIDIGSGAGKHTEILRAAGLNVFQLDKYSDTAEYQVDFMSYNFDRKFDVVFCSHVIEHQRNVGNFLDKIYDIMSDQGILILVAPKHSASTLIEGHLNCFQTTYFIQHLIHAGFDLKSGKYLSCHGIENAAIVSKAKNFNFMERGEDGYIWTTEHQERVFFELKNCTLKDGIFFHNCTVLRNVDSKIQVVIPENYEPAGLEINGQRWGVKFII